MTLSNISRMSCSSFTSHLACYSFMPPWATIALYVLWTKQLLDENTRKLQDSDTTNPKRRSIASATCYSSAFLGRCYRVLALSLIHTTGEETYLEKHLNFGWVKLIAFFDTRVSFEEGASSNSSAHPFNRDHFTVSCYECCVTVFSDKSRFDS